MRLIATCILATLLLGAALLAEAKAAAPVTGWCQMDVIRGGVPARIVKPDDFCRSELVQAPAPSPTLGVWHPTHSPRRTPTARPPVTVTPWGR